MKEFDSSNYSKLIERNFTSLNEYFEDKLYHFVELTTLRNEILQCLLLELNQASIFSTNHFLERIIKLALINKYTVNLDYSEPALYNEKTLEAVEKYDNLKLFYSLKLAVGENLITEEEYTILDNFRDKIRNPYSHAEIKRITNGAPEKFTGFMFNINDVMESLKKGEEIKPGIKTEITTLSSAFSQFFQESFSKEIAFKYFKIVYSTLKNIEKRIELMKAST